MSSVNFSVNFSLMTCGGCGISFAVPEEWKQQKINSHGSFNCPNGCSRQFIGKTRLEVLEEEKLSVQSRLNEERHLRIVKERELEKIKAEKERLEKRVSNGACPCCKRSFVNLQQHMRTKHPDKVIGPGTVKAIA